MKLNDLLALAESSFTFLQERGFELRSRVPAPNDNFRQGWVLEYDSPLVYVRIEYLDWQFNVVFTHRGTKVTYLTIDRELYARHSGLYGDMFPPDKLADTIQLVAGDIRDSYADVVAGDDKVWAKIQRLVEAPTIKPKLP